MMTPILAVISGEVFLKQLMYLFAFIVCALILWLLGRYVFPKMKAPEVVLTVWDIFFVVLGAFLLINFIMGGIFERPWIVW
jgi:hypothetical protein